MFKRGKNCYGRINGIRNINKNIRTVIIIKKLQELEDRK